MKKINFSSSPALLLSQLSPSNIVSVCPIMIVFAICAISIRARHSAQGLGNVVVDDDLWDHRISKRSPRLLLLLNNAGHCNDMPRGYLVSSCSACAENPNIWCSQREQRQLDGFSGVL